MQMRNYIMVCIVLCTVISCKKVKATGQPEGQNQIIENPIQVVVNMTIKKADALQMFYVENESDEFEDKKSVWVEVPGKNESQEVVFNLPDDITIGNLRFDPGQNPEQDEVMINSMIIRQREKEMEISGAEFFMYFSPLKVHVETFPGKLSFKGKKVGEIYDPSFSGNKDFVLALKKFNE